MAKSYSRRWTVALAYTLGSISILIAIPFFCYLLLRLDLSLKASSIGKPPLLDEPVAGRDIEDLVAFAPLKKEKAEEESAAIKAMRQRYRELLPPSEAEEQAQSDWSGLRRWERQWVPVELPASLRIFPPVLEEEMNEVAAFVRRPDADFRFGNVRPSEVKRWDLEIPAGFGVMPDMIGAHFLRGVMRLEAGEPTKALEEVETLLNYGKFYLRRPNLLTFGFQRLAYQQAVRLIWEGLQRGAWTRGELGVLRMRLGYLQYFKGADSAMRGEVFYQQRLNEAELGFRKGAIPYLATYTLLRRDQQTYLHWLQPMLTDMDEPNWVNRYALEDLQGEQDGQTAWQLITGSADPVLAGGRLRLILQAQMLITAVDTACALELYRQEHGQFPDTLEALKERHLVTGLPPDPIDGDPLLYRRESDGSYLLWSLGWNLTDDQGTVVFTTDTEGKPTACIDSVKGDWLWKMPPVRK